MSQRVSLMLLIALLGLAPCLAARAGDAPPTSEEVVRGLASRSFGTRRDAVWAARDHPDASYLERLLVLARHDAHPNIRAWSLEALARYEDERILPTLHAAIGEEESPFPKDKALEMLGRLRAPGAYEVLVAHLAPRSRGSAVMRGLAALGDPRAFDVVLDFWDRHRDDPYVAPAAPEVLVALDANRGRDACLARFADAPDGFRRTLETTLAAAGGASVREAMATHLGSSHAAVRHSAARVLGEAGDGGTDSLLLERFRAVPEDRAVLARAIGQRGYGKAVPTLADALGSKNMSSDVRGAIAAALGVLADARGAEALMHALPREPDARATVQIAVALGRIGDARAARGLRTFVDDDRISRQPRTISSIWVFPWNCRVGDAALWAWATITDGRPPFDPESLSGFPEPPGPDAREALAALRGRVR